MEEKKREGVLIRDRGREAEREGEKTPSHATMTYVSSRQRPCKLSNHVPSPEQSLPQIAIHQQLILPLFLGWAWLSLLRDGMWAGDEEGTAYLPEQVAQRHVQVIQPVHGRVHVSVCTQLQGDNGY
jgi:hypothetical protein